MKLASSNVVVVGLGKSGRAAAELCAKQGARVHVLDSKNKEELSETVSGLEDLGVELHLGDHDPRFLEGADVIVLSPGVPLELPGLKEAEKSGAHVVGEIEVAWQVLKQSGDDVKIALITGSNGKSTVTVWVSRMLEASGMRVFTGGNLGKPLSELALSGDSPDWAVLEVSSFQLDTMDRFEADTCCLLNLAPDHLDRYGGEPERYYSSKVSAFSRLKPGAFGIVGPDPEAVRRSRIYDSSLVYASMHGKVERGVYLDGGRIVWKYREAETFFDKERIRLPGVHNLANALCACGTAMLCGASEQGVQEALDSFEGLPHRMEFVRRLNGVSYYNDSKATNPAAAAAGLTGFDDGTVVLIAGGRAKGTGFETMRDQVARAVRVLLLIGEAAGEMKDALADVAGDVVICSDLAQAVNLASKKARPGDSVVLSPACASFDQFRDFEHRGEVFRREVKAL